MNLEYDECDQPEGRWGISVWPVVGPATILYPIIPHASVDPIPHATNQHAGIEAWVQCGYMWVGTREVGKKNNSLAETLSKLRFYGSSTLSTPQLIDKWV
jgi:hypothetical protein